LYDLFYLSANSPSDDVDRAGHVGGALAGIAASMFLRRRL